MFWDWIDRTRKKSKATRDRYAFTGAAAITGIIVLIWVFSLPTLLKHVESKDDIAEEERFEGAFSKFFGDVKDQGANIISTIKDQASTTMSANEQSTDEVPVFVPAHEMQLTASSADMVAGEDCSTSTSSDCSVQHEDTEPKKEGKTVLIGTTSAAQKATSTNQ